MVGHDAHLILRYKFKETFGAQLPLSFLIVVSTYLMLFYLRNNHASLSTITMWVPFHFSNSSFNTIKSIYLLSKSLTAFTKSFEFCIICSFKHFQPFRFYEVIHRTGRYMLILLSTACKHSIKCLQSSLFPVPLAQDATMTSLAQRMIL